MSEQITAILMPKWDLSMKEGTLAAWHVEEGAEIAPGDEIMDIETDKIASVVEAAADAGHMVQMENATRVNELIKAQL